MSAKTSCSARFWEAAISRTFRCSRASLEKTARTVPLGLLANRSRTSGGSRNILKRAWYGSSYFVHCGSWVAGVRARRCSFSPSRYLVGHGRAGRSIGCSLLWATGRRRRRALGGSACAMVAGPWASWPKDGRRSLVPRRRRRGIGDGGTTPPRRNARLPECHLVQSFRGTNRNEYPSSRSSSGGDTPKAVSRKKDSSCADVPVR
jgi:hypothetical protein